MRIINEKVRAVAIAPKRKKVNGNKYPGNLCTQFRERLVFGVAPDQPGHLTLTLLHPGVLRKILWRPSSRNRGEAHIYKEIEIRGEREVAMVLHEILNSFKGRLWKSFGLRSFCSLCLLFLAPQRISIRYVCGARPIRVGEPVWRSAPILIFPPMFLAFGWERDSTKPALIPDPSLILDPCS